MPLISYIAEVHPADAFFLRDVPGAEHSGDRRRTEVGHTIGREATAQMQRHVRHAVVDEPATESPHHLLACVPAVHEQVRDLQLHPRLMDEVQRALHGSQRSPIEPMIDIIADALQVDVRRIEIRQEVA